jgi:hypothetical protein
MASWLVKAIVQRSIAALPNPHFWNGLLQERLTHSLELTDERFDASLDNCQNHLDQLRRHNPTAPTCFSAFELGTGWFPIVSVGLFLCGAREVSTWDIAPHVKLARVRRVIGRFLELDQDRELEDRLPVQPERLATLREIMRLCESPDRLLPAQIFARLGIHYRIGDAAKSGLPPQSVDLIVSDVVLEYLSPAELTEVLREFQRIAAPDAVLSHSINLRDQYASFDTAITQVNFLRFSDRLWGWLNNPITPLNRLRASDYRRAFSENGFEIVDEAGAHGDPAELARIRLAPQFRRYSVEDLLVLHMHLAATPRRC